MAMKNNRLWIVMASLLALLSAPIATPSPAYACFYPTSTQEALDGAYVAFIGKVVAFEDQPYVSSGDSKTYILKSAIFEVTAVYKGTVGPKAILSPGLSHFDHEFRHGEEMLVFAHRHQDVNIMYPDLYETNITQYGERLHTSYCYGTARLNSEWGQQVKTELGPGNPPAVNASQDGFLTERSVDGGIPLVAIAVLVALVTGGAAIIFVLLKHKTKKAAS